MSKIGKKIIIIPDGIKTEIKDNKSRITIESPYITQGAYEGPVHEYRWDKEFAPEFERVLASYSEYMKNEKKEQVW